MTISALYIIGHYYRLSTLRILPKNVKLPGVSSWLLRALAHIVIGEIMGTPK